MTPAEGRGGGADGADRAANRRNLLLIAARVPTAGATKTRLGAQIGMERAARLYRAFLADLAQRFTAESNEDLGFDLGWAYTPADADFAAVLADLPAPTTAALRYVAQSGDGWGERQGNLLRWGRDRGYEATVLVASDSPQLPRATVDEAFRALVSHDVAVGRVLDGGYYLIGLRNFHDVFSGVAMSTGTAADALVRRAEALGLAVAELPSTFDIDEAADLRHLVSALAPSGGPAPATWAALHALDLLPRHEGEAGPPLGSGDR